jgi:hypothetical protein
MAATWHGILFQPDHCGGYRPSTGERFPSLSECLCGAIGVDPDRLNLQERKEIAERVGVPVHHLEAVRACTCGRPICDECWVDVCPHTEDD